ncbi:MAG: hypothetical protein SNJ56_00640 [Termitinemataceae bacterium]
MKDTPDKLEQLEQELRESQESQFRLLNRVSELEHRLQSMEFQRRTMNQLLASIIDMDTASGGDRTSLKRRIKIVGFIDDYLQNLESSASQLSLHDILQSLLNSPQEFSLPQQGIHIDTFFEITDSIEEQHYLSTQTALILAICIADIFAVLLSISSDIFLKAFQRGSQDILSVRCLAGTNSRSVEELLNQMLNGSFFMMLHEQVSTTFLPPNPREGPGLHLEIHYR